VVAAGETRRTELQRTAERFAQAKASIVGLVLNEVSKQNGYGGGYGYGYGTYQPDPAMAGVPAQANGSAEAHSPRRGKRGHRSS